MGSAPASEIRNFGIYNSPAVACHYAALEQITPCERVLLETYLEPGSAVLDVGVGGGRTTAYLAPRVSRYLGIDYAPEMIEACRRKFPELDFIVGDASDLSLIPAASFDAVVMAFNVIDYVLPAEKRLRCWRECHRVLKPGGVLIFSSHNPRAILVRRSWNRERVETLSRKGAETGTLQQRLTFLMLSGAAQLLSLARSCLSTMRRSASRLFAIAFWRGEGCVVDPAHGGLLTHCWIPRQAVAEVQGSRFTILKVLGDDYPAPSSLYSTAWYYYVFAKRDQPSVP